MLPLALVARARSAPALLILLVAACGAGGDAASNDAPPPSAPSATTSFSRIQTRILAPQCVSCHTGATASVVQSGLVLDAGVAYENLVGARSTNVTARADGMLRVTPFKADSSLLYHKLSWIPGHHVHDYGVPMPLGTTEGLSQGQLEFVRRWIEAGASRTGDNIDTLLLADRTAQRVPAFAPLARPSDAIQLRVDSFPVRGNFERELFVYRTLGNTGDVYVNRMETKMRPGSHHFVLYSYDESRSPLCALRPSPNAVRDIRNADGTMNIINMLPMACHVFFGGAMAQSGEYTFPDGVALRVPAGLGLDMNVHYVNRTGAEFPGEAYINLYTVDRSRVRTVARTLNLGNTDFTLPAGKRTTVTKTFAVSDTTMTIFALTSHMHMRGERFVIRIKGGTRDGEIVYESSDWSHPVMQSYAPAIVLRRGQSLVSEVTYFNESDHVVRFGLTSEDEMAIIFGYYY